MNTTSAALFQKANELADRGQLQEAQQTDQQAIAEEPQFAEAHNKLGMVFVWLEDGAKALKQFHEAYTIKPSLQEAFTNFAQLLMVLFERGYTATIIKDNFAVRDLITRAKARRASVT
jgi:tetratricopeptide (TPR) repeat protein